MSYRTEFPNLAVKLAAAFADLLRAELSPAEFVEMRRRNASPDYVAACASHDFLDANMTMLAAFESVMGESPAFLNPPEYDGTDHDQNVVDNSDADMALWNEAWNIAKAQHLTGDA